MDSRKLYNKLSDWELWPFSLRYLPISPAWVQYCLRSKSVWFFTPSNPTLTFGGFEGESKKEMYNQLPPASYPKTIYIQPYIPVEEVLQKAEAAAIRYPFIVKPDVGMEGILVRKIHSPRELELYHQKMPAEYIIQQLSAYSTEYSVFYYRFPDHEKGVITGFLQKIPMQVTGDGNKTLHELVLEHPKAMHRLAEIKLRHREHLRTIIPTGEVYPLSHAANLNRGAHFINLQKEIDEQLLSVFDAISHHTGSFFYGRFDLKAASVEDLKEGKNFSILEFNGCGAEPNHIYNSGYTLRQAHKEILKHWNVLYQIARINHHRGIRYWSFLSGWIFLKKARAHFKQLRKLDV